MLKRKIAAIAVTLGACLMIFPAVTFAFAALVMFAIWDWHHEWAMLAIRAGFGVGVIAWVKFAADNDGLPKLFRKIEQNHQTAKEARDEIDIIGG